MKYCIPGNAATIAHNAEIGHFTMTGTAAGGLVRAIIHLN